MYSLMMSVRFLSDCLMGYFAMSHWNLVKKVARSMPFAVRFSSSFSRWSSSTSLR